MVHDDASEVLDEHAENHQVVIDFPREFPLVRYFWSAPDPARANLYTSSLGSRDSRTSP